MVRITRYAVIFTYDDAAACVTCSRKTAAACCETASSADQTGSGAVLPAVIGSTLPAASDKRLSTQAVWNSRIADVTKVQRNLTGGSRSPSLAVARIALLLVVVFCQPRVAPALANDAVAQDLADCQDEDKAPELRVKVCTVLIGTHGLDDGLKAEALLNRGMARQDTDDLPGAISDYTDAIALNPEYPALYVQRADAYADSGDLEQAIKDMTHAIGLAPDDADSFAGRGDLYAETGEVTLAEADYRKALTLEPDHKEAIEGLKDLRK